jgi:hypothetical protein
MNLINLTVGDESGDGHKFFDKFLVSSNLTKSELLLAYKAGCKKLGFNLTDYCRDYEEDTLPRQPVFKIASQLRMPFNDFINKTFEDVFDTDVYLADGESEIKEDDDVTFRVWPSDWLYLWMSVCQVGNPLLAWEEVDIDSIHIDGYGLFQ